MWILRMKYLKMGQLADPQIAPFLANWQTPFFSKWPTTWGPKHFSLNRPPFNLDFVYKLYQKNLNWSIVG